MPDLTGMNHLNYVYELKETSFSDKHNIFKSSFWYLRIKNNITEFSTGIWATTPLMLQELQLGSRQYNL